MKRFKDFDVDLHEDPMFYMGSRDFYVETMNWVDVKTFNELQKKNKDWVSRWQIQDAVTPGLKLVSFGLWIEDNPIGQIVLWNVDLFNGTASLSYWIDKDHARRGFMSKAVSYIFDSYAGLLDLSTIYVPIQKENAASIGLANKLGLTLSGSKFYKSQNGSDVEHLIYKKDI